MQDSVCGVLPSVLKGGKGILLSICLREQKIAECMRHRAQELPQEGGWAVRGSEVG